VYNIDVKNVLHVFYSCHVFYVFNAFLFSPRFFKNVHKHLKILPRTSRKVFKATKTN